MSVETKAFHGAPQACLGCIYKRGEGQFYGG